MHGLDLRRVRVLVPSQDLGGESGVDEEHVSWFDHHLVRSHDLFEGRKVDWLPVVAKVMGDVDEDTSALHPVGGHVLEALWYFSCTDWSIHSLPMCWDLQPQMEDAPVTIPANQLFFHRENVIIRMERGSGTARREGSP
jgi:hypothetical protein